MSTLASDTGQSLVCQSRAVSGVCQSRAVSGVCQSRAVSGVCQSRAVSCTPLPQVTWLAVSLAAHTMYIVVVFLIHNHGCVVDMEHHSTLNAVCVVLV